MRKYMFFICLLFLYTVSSAQNGNTIPTNQQQTDFLKTYKAAIHVSADDYHSTGNDYDTQLFSSFGERSVYWITSGSLKGNFLMPTALPDGFTNISADTYSNYQWNTNEHLSLQINRNKTQVAVFKSNIRAYNNSASWQALYFKSMFENYLYKNMYTFVDEISVKNMPDDIQLLIIPDFASRSNDARFYPDSIFEVNNGLREAFDEFLAGGGTVYTEGNAVYFLQKLGYLPAGSVDFSNSFQSPDNGLVNINIKNAQHPVSFASEAVNQQMYAGNIPFVSFDGLQSIVELAADNRPLIFEIKTGGGRIICNLALPTVGGIAGVKDGSRQLQWTLNTLLSAFTSPLDVCRNVRNELANGIAAGKNAVSYDRIDEFDVNIVLRNLSSQSISGVEITEKIRDYFDFVDVATAGVEFQQEGNELKFSDISVAAQSETVITYTLKTPEPESGMHENVDDYITKDYLIYASQSNVKFSYNNTTVHFSRQSNYTDIMFSARIDADTDVNWKNFLGLEYQPFKVFTIMENKERTSAEETKYVQYIPKDVPFYRVDKGLNIPVVKTPGGKFVDVLKGSDSQTNPDYDFDSDGKPDAWLDVNSIYPKNYTLEEVEIYWANPWAHLQSGEEYPVYEDIDHDGLRAQDTDGDGIVDIEEPGDKIRAWKVTWNIQRVEGYEYFDPYCSYELWIDPPDIVNLAEGVGYAHGDISATQAEMFYPYTENIENADLNDERWKHWMETDENGNIVWKDYIHQSINNYEGFTFVDIQNGNYELKPTDTYIGRTPQPRREFIAVVSLGGPEIDMTQPTPTISYYSNVDYKTIFGEERQTPIRTTYTYYAPLPNPLQFEYLTNTYTIQHPETGETMDFLPQTGEANLILVLYKSVWVAQRKNIYICPKKEI